MELAVDDLPRSSLRKIADERDELVKTGFDWPALPPHKREHNSFLLPKSNRQSVAARDLARLASAVARAADFMDEAGRVD
jgi:hypothetical protein